MCGIFGWQWQEHAKPSREARVKVALALGLLNDNRGGKSWGYAGLPQGKMESPFVSRGLGNIVGEASRLATWTSLMGHTRMPTNGSVSVDNAHPFEFGNIIGAHNGMVYNWRSMEEKYPERKPFAVDSMHIIAHLAEGKDFGELECYGAIEWIDRTQPGIIYLSRLTDGGDLCLVKTEQGVLWSSSKDHMDKALEAACLKATKRYRTDPGEVVFVEAGKLYAEERKLLVKEWRRASSTRIYPSSPYVATALPSGGSTAQYDPADWTTEDDMVCQNATCGSPVRNGECVTMFDDQCTGSDAFILRVSDNSVKARQELGSPAVSAATSSEAVALTGDTLKGDVNFTELVNAECPHHRKGVPLSGSGYHVEDHGGGTKSYHMCLGPSVWTTSHYTRTRKLLGDRVALVRKGYGWITTVDGESFYDQDYQRAVAAAAVTAPNSGGAPDTQSLLFCFCGDKLRADETTTCDACAGKQRSSGDASAAPAASTPTESAPH